jgi:hypothetical protein
MSDPKEEKIEKKLEEPGAPNQDGELSETDFENVSGGAIAGDRTSGGCMEKA